MKKQQIILITGATSGIGRFTALHLARAGHRVFASGRNQTALAQLASEAPAGLETLRLDVTDAASIAQAKATVDARTNGYGLDVLVNNAGYGTAGPTELITDEDLRAQYDVNVFGLMAMTRAFVPQMRARGAGRVVNVSSLGGRLTLPFLGAYNSTKYAVESLSDALRVELAPFGVRISLIEPGVIETAFADRSVAEAAKYHQPDSPYRPVLDRMDEIRRMSDRTAVGPACIARAIERAATARRPRARYVAPLRAGLAIGFLRALPTALADAILRLTFGLTRRRFRAALALMLLAAAALPAAAHAQEAPWEPVANKKGIVVDRRHVAGSNLKEFRGRGVIDAPLASVLAVFSDVDRATEWMDSCNGSRSLEDQGERVKIVYNRTHAGWPVADRDAVLRNELIFDEATGRVRLEFSTVAQASAPPVKGVVRMPSLRGHWYLWPEGRTTRVEYQVWANPGGSLPDWLVNYVSRELPRKTILGLQAQVKRRSYPEVEQRIRAFPEYQRLAGAGI